MMQDHREPAPSSGRLAKTLRFLLPLAIIVLAGMGAVRLVQTGPQTKSRRPPPRATLVEVKQINRTDGATTVEAMGMVVPSREVVLRPQVSGEIVELSRNLIPGGSFQKQEVLLRIDPSDYELAVRQLTSDVVQAESNLQLEQGNQEVAQREYELLGQEVSEKDRDLVLRRPQMDNIRAGLEKARAKLAQAKLDLKRTVIRAPFNAVIRSRQVNLGARVTPSTTLATLVGTDSYWIEVLVPVRQLKWLRVPGSNAEQSSPARVYDPAAWGEGAFRTGRVVRVAANLEEQGRMARLFVAVADPLGLTPGHSNQPKLFIGSYVRVSIQGRELGSMIEVERALIRDGDHVWVMDDEDKLSIRKVKIAFRDRDRVLVADGIEPGERLVVTDLAAPVEGMALRTSEKVPLPAASAVASQNGDHQ
ncbi:MAG: efflux RND transporter periplasmic adaptor subunit [Deltaproteobacteria bacterium]|jgi:RND family efflux transporter MFP subunit